MTTEPVRSQLPLASSLETPPTRRPQAVPRWVAPAVVGGVLVPVVIALGYRALAGRLTAPDWPGMPPRAATVASHGILVAATLAAGLMFAVWIWLRRRTEGGLRLRFAGLVALIWGVPLALGPPLLSNDIYSYAAVGRLASADLDPYTVGPAALGGGPFLAAVDPLWRHTPTPYGPLLVTLFHADAWAARGSVLTTILLLRVAAVVFTVGAVVLTVWAARPSQRPAVLLLVALNPIVLLHLLAGTHMDALIGAAAVGVVLLAVAGWWAPAMVLAVLATMVKAPAVALVGFVFLYALRRAPAQRRLRAGAGVVGVAAATTGVLWLMLPNAFGWVHALSVPAEIGNPRVPSAWLSWLMRGVAALAGAHLHGHTAGGISRAVTLLVGGVVAVVLLVRATARRDREHALRHVGWALLVIAISTPVVYGWYLAWGLFPAAAGSRSPRERWALVGVSALIFALTAPAIRTVPGLQQVGLWLVAALACWWAAGRPLPGRRPPVTGAT